MGRYRTDLTFTRTAPDEVRIYRDGQYIGDIYTSTRTRTSSRQAATII